MLDEFEVELLELLDEAQTIEQLEDDELKLEDEADEMLEVSNSVDETEAELIDGEVEVDDGDETEVYETEAETMINELEEEVDMLYQQLLIECLLNEVEVRHEIIEALLLFQLINKLVIYKIRIKTIL